MDRFYRTRVPKGAAVRRVASSEKRSIARDRDIFVMLNAVASKMRFADSVTLQEHFVKHGQDLGVTNAYEYEALAAAFLGSTRSDRVLECQRTGGDTLRFCQITLEYGIRSQSGVIRTYYKPVRCKDLPVGVKKKCHRHPTHEIYFQAECKRHK